MNLFDQCSLKYKFKYHDALPVDEEKEYFEFGKFIHMVFELHIRDKKSIKEAYDTAFEKHNKFGSSYKSKISRIINNFIQFNENLYKNSSVKEEHIELKFNLQEEEFQFFGFIDRLIFLDNGKAIILDYKTSQKHNELDSKEIKTDGQLMKYAYVVHKMFAIPLDSIYCALFYVDSNTVRYTGFDTEKIYNHISDTLLNARKIREMEPSNAKPNLGSHCKFCEFGSYCTKYQKYKKLTG